LVAEAFSVGYLGDDLMLLSKQEVTDLINENIPLALAGDEEILKDLPKGQWIGGTIPYFMTLNGGTSTRDKIFVNSFPNYIENVQIVNYDPETIANVYANAPANGFSLIIIPATSDIHLDFALHAPMFDAFATRPLIGWISGVHLDNLETAKAKVFNGKTGEVFDNKAVVMNITLPQNKFADIGIVNIFSQGEGDTIEFLEDGFVQSNVLINDQKRNFAEYIKEKNLDTRLPLVADYLGVMINVSFQRVDEKENEVHFYAPVFKGQKYIQAKSVGDYVKAFTKQIPKEAEKIIFSCNCILNYLYSELEGKKTGTIVGPITFGEVAYQLVNQTLAYLSIQDVVYEEPEDVVN
jgi:hypothetical protein